MTGRQLNPLVPSNGCIVFCPHRARGSAHRKDFKSTFVNLYCLFFWCFFPPPSLAHFSMPTDFSARGSEGGGKEGG